jgi:hypothetical protein
VESPYRPPQEIEPVEYAALGVAPDSFRMESDERQMVGKLAKYLADIGGLLIFLAAVSLLMLMFLMFGSVAMQFPGAPVRMIGALVVQLLQQSVNIGFLFAIGWCMRRAAAPFRRASESTEHQIHGIMQSMERLRTLYGWQMTYVALGIVLTLLTTLFNLPL